MDSPDCLRANLLLGFWLAQGTAKAKDEGQRLLARAAALDPAGAVAAELFPDQPIPDALLTPARELPELGETADNELAERPAPEPIDIERARTRQARPEQPAARSTNEALPRAEPAQAQPEKPATKPIRSAQAGGADVGEWLRDRNEEAATVMEALESRLAPKARSRPSESSELPADLAAEWSDLLDQEITLDSDSEARLSRALTEVGLSSEQGSEEGWVEVRAGEGARERLSEVARGERPTEPPLKSSSKSAASPGGPKPAEAGGMSVSGTTAGGTLTGGAPISGTPIGGTPIEKAAALWRDGEAQKALDLYREVLNSSPDQAEQVVAGLKGLIQSHPSLIQAHRVLGDAFMRAGQFQQAIEEYNAALASRQG